MQQYKRGAAYRRIEESEVRPRFVLLMPAACSSSRAFHSDLLSPSVVLPLHPSHSYSSVLNYRTGFEPPLPFLLYGEKKFRFLRPFILPSSRYWYPLLFQSKSGILSDSRRIGESLPFTLHIATELI